MSKISIVRVWCKCFIACMCLSVAVINTYAQELPTKTEKDISLYEKVNVGQEAALADGQLSDIYVRMMRYQTAGQDISRIMSGRRITPEEYLTIAVKNVNIGKKGKLIDYLQQISNQDGYKVLKIDKYRSCPESDKCRLYYTVDWVDRGTVGAEPNAFVSLNGQEEYLTYDVTVSYRGKSLSHGGLILYYEPVNIKGKYFVYDGLIPQINGTAQDRLPLAQAEDGNAAMLVSALEQQGGVDESVGIEPGDGSPYNDNVIGYLPSGNVKNVRTDRNTLNQSSMIRRPGDGIKPLFSSGEICAETLLLEGSWILGPWGVGVVAAGIITYTAYDHRDDLYAVWQWICNACKRTSTATKTATRTRTMQECAGSCVPYAVGSIACKGGDNGEGDINHSHGPVTPDQRHWHTYVVNKTTNPPCGCFWNPTNPDYSLSSSVCNAGVYPRESTLPAVQWVP